MKEILDFFKRQPLLTGVAAMAAAVGGIKLIDADGYLAAGLHRFILAFAMGVFLYLISGEKTPEKSVWKTTGYVVRALIGFLVFAGVLGAFGIAGRIYMGTALCSRWPLEFFGLAFTVLGVGLFEEMTFRAVLNDAIVYQFRNSKGIFVVSAVVTSLLFGWVHVMDADVSGAFLMTQAVLKTVSTGMFGLGMLFLYWKTRNIWGCAIVHAIYDLLPAITDTIFVSEHSVLVGSYVKTGVVEGYIGIFILSFQIFVMFIILLFVWKKVVKTIDFEEMRKTW